MANVVTIPLAFWPANVVAMPPDDSRLFSSLERGHFRDTFTSCQPIGRGGFGTVMKAWHVIDAQWYAVKLIPLELHSSETVDDSCKGWSGIDIFNQLVRLRSPSLVRYYRRWTEIAEDVFDDNDQLGSEKIIKSEHRSQSASHVSLDSTDRCVDTSDFSLKFDYGQTVASEGGFEWLYGCPDTGDDTSNSNHVHVKEGDPERRKTYRVVLAIQMEYFDGVTLDKWIADPGIRQGLTVGNFEGALGLFKQLMIGLALLHHKGIVHRDVKPNNVMISRANGQLKIIDFGTSSRVAKESSPKISPKLPPEGILDSLVEIGTAGYAPPEQCTLKSSPRSASPKLKPVPEADVLPEADVFSAGIILVELLMAVVKNGPAWDTCMERATGIEALRAGHGELAALPIELRPILGTPMQGWLRQLMVRMLAWDGHVRPSSQEVLSELQAKFFSKEKHNPYVGVLRRSSHRLCGMADPPPTVQNPYVGFFLDHAPRPFENSVAMRD